MKENVFGKKRYSGRSFSPMAISLKHLTDAKLNERNSIAQTETKVSKFPRTSRNYSQVNESNTYRYNTKQIIDINKYH